MVSIVASQAIDPGSIPGWRRNSLGHDATNGPGVIMDKEEKCDLPSREWRGFESRSCLREIFNFSCNQRQRKIAPNFGIKSGLGHCKTSTRKVRQPGIEPGSIAWKATMLTFTPPTPWQLLNILLTWYPRGKNPQKLMLGACKSASAGNRTRIYCLEGNNANLYTTDAVAKGTLKRGCMIGKQDEMNMHFFQHIFFY